MALNFGNNQLFQQGPLQENGSLSERWGQPGSVIKNYSGALGTNYTVTAGKRLFITSLTFEEDSGASTFFLKDGGAGGTQKFSGTLAAQGTLTITLQTPIYCDTDVYTGNSVGTTNAVSYTGWEEDKP